MRRSAARLHVHAGMDHFAVRVPGLVCACRRVFSSPTLQPLSIHIVPHCSVHFSTHIQFHDIPTVFCASISISRPRIAPRNAMRTARAKDFTHEQDAQLIHPASPIFPVVAT